MYTTANMTRPARYNFKTRPEAHREAIVAGSKYRFTVLTDGLLRLEYAHDGRFEDRASTFAINRKLAVPDFYVWDRGHVLEIVTKRFHVVYNKKKFSADGLVVYLKGNLPTKWQYGQKLSNLGGTIRTLDQANGRVDLSTGVLSRDGIAVIDDTDSTLFESNGWIAPRRDGERSDEYLFCYGHDYRDAIRAYYAVSGSQPLLPRFAMGNWWSRYHRYDEKEYLDLHDHFERDEVPMNVAVVDMDWHLVRGGDEGDTRTLPEGANGWTGYTWNKKLFADPDAFMKKLHDRGMKITLNLHPADGFRSWEDQYPDVARAMDVDPKTGETVPFDCTDKKFMDVYFDLVHHEHEARGVDFWWIDWQQGEGSKIPGVDPLWVLNHFHFLDIGRGNERPLIFSRFGGPGAQRYQVGFSGDTYITWETLNFQPEFTATASNIGYAWWSNDIGGHTGGYKNDELYTRWVQLGCWSPILRLHSDTNPFNTREPWAFNEEARTIVEDTLRYRHRLIPYTYTMNARAASNDEPLITPMYWDWQERDEAYTVPNQFRFGSELIVAPITQGRDVWTTLGAVNVWLPPMRLVDVFTGVVYDGDRKTTLHRPLSQTPVLAAEGAIIPLDAAWRPKSGSPNPDAIEILLVVGADGAFNLIEDDGKGTRVEDGDFAMVETSETESSEDDTVNFVHTPITYTQSTGVLTIGPTYPPHHPSIPKNREWKVRLISHSPRGSASTSDSSTSPVQCLLTQSSKRATLHAHTISSVSNGTLISLASAPTSSILTINLTGNHPSHSTPQLDIIDPIPLCIKIINDAGEWYNTKWDIGNTLDNPGLSVAQKIAELQGKNLKKELLEAMLEVLTADRRYEEKGLGMVGSKMGEEGEYEMC